MSIMSYDLTKDQNRSSFQSSTPTVNILQFSIQSTKLDGKEHIAPDSWLPPRYNSGELGGREGGNGVGKGEGWGVGGEENKGFEVEAETGEVEADKAVKSSGGEDTSTAAMEGENQGVIGEGEEGRGTVNGLETDPPTASTLPTDKLRNNSNLQCLMNIIKANVGTGILALPQAFQYGGLWVTCVCLLILAVISVHCMHLLVIAAHRLRDRLGPTGMDYGEVVEATFRYGPLKVQRHARAAKIVINVFLCVSQIGFCTVYILFIADNILSVIQNYAVLNINPQTFTVIVFVALIPYIMFVTNLKILSYFAMFANCLHLIGLIFILQFCFTDVPSISTVQAFGGWSTFPLFFGIVVFAFEGIGVIMPIENRMRTPDAMRGLLGMLNIGLLVVTVLYVIVGFFGYLKMGSATAGSITLNLPNTWNYMMVRVPRYYAIVYYMMVRVLFAVSVYISYNLQMYVPADLLWTLLKRRLTRKYKPDQPIPCYIKYGERILKLLLLLLTFILAASLPQLGLMISLVGCVSGSAMAFIFPTILDFVSLATIGPIGWLTIVKNIGIIVIGFVGFAVGTAVTIQALVQAFET